MRWHFNYCNSRDDSLYRSWESLGLGISAKTNTFLSVSSLSVSKDGTLFAGGSFSVAGEQTCRLVQVHVKLHF